MSAAEGEDGEELKSEHVSRQEPEEKKKRKAIDKQIAFIEFKETGEGQTLKERISEFRE